MFYCAVGNKGRGIGLITSKLLEVQSTIGKPGGAE
jgi:hypothetical protein